MRSIKKSTQKRHVKTHKKNSHKNRNKKGGNNCKQIMTKDKCRRNGCEWVGNLETTDVGGKMRHSLCQEKSKTKTLKDCIKYKNNQKNCEENGCRFVSGRGVDNYCLPK